MVLFYCVCVCVYVMLGYAGSVMVIATENEIKFWLGILIFMFILH